MRDRTDKSKTTTTKTKQTNKHTKKNTAYGQSNHNIATQYSGRLKASSWTFSIAGTLNEV